MIVLHFQQLIPFRSENVSNGGCLDIQFSHGLFVYYSLVAERAIYPQMVLMIVYSWYLLFIICLFFLMAVYIFHSATDWLLTIA